MEINKTKQFYILKSLFLLSIPTVIEELLSTLLQYVDTAMVGRLGERATATVSVTLTINWLISGIYHGISIAILAILSKSFGERDNKKITKISNQVFYITLFSSLLTLIFSLSIAKYIPHWMGAEESIRDSASLYFIIISIPMYFRNVITIYGSALRATTDTKTPMIITIIENISNIVLNYILIYICNIGVIGAALATAISYILAGILMIIKYQKNRYLHINYKQISIDTTIIKNILKIATPLILTNTLSCIGYTIFAGLVSHMGTTIFAAHSIAITAETIFYITCYGFRSSTSIMIGISLGEQDYNKYVIIKRLSMMIIILMMSINGIILYNINEILMRLFTSSEQVIKYGSEVLKIIALSEPFYGLMIVSEGIYYGLGNTKYVFIVETLCMYFIRIFLTFIAINYFNADLKMIWYCMICDNIAKSILLFIPIIKNNYKYNFITN